MSSSKYLKIKHDGDAKNETKGGTKDKSNSVIIYKQGKN